MRIGEIMEGSDKSNLYAGMRSSNIELLRIVAMLAIVAHHYVVNSTVWELFDPFRPTANSIFLQLWGMWGKAAINVFVLITGYFMCQSRLTAKRYLKILLQIIFYSWVMWFVLTAFGYEHLSLGGAVKRLYCHYILTCQDNGFVPAFMWMYLLIPALNVYLRGASKKNLYGTLGVLVVMFSLCGTILNANVYHHVFWYATLYLAGAAIRMYPFRWMNCNKICICLLVASVAAAWCSVVSLNFMVQWLGRPIRALYFFVSDSHKILALSTALFMFLVFKNWKVPQSRFVNAVASTTFGVLLIHAATDGMRKWLWQDFINVPGAYSFSLPALVAYSVVTMIGVFAVCSVLDYFRIRFLERPLFGYLKNHGIR